MNKEYTVKTLNAFVSKSKIPHQTASFLQLCNNNVMIKSKVINYSNYSN